MRANVVLAILALGELFSGSQAFSAPLTPSSSFLLPQSQVFQLLDHFPGEVSRLGYLGAIIQIQGLDFPPATIKGQAIAPLHRLQGGQVFALDVQIGQTSGRFLLDTGASTTLIATSLVQELGLVGTPIPGDRLTSAVAGKDCPDMRAVRHQLPTLSLSQIQIEGLHGLEFASTVIPEDLAGVLGMDVLRYFDLNLNPQTQELQLLSPQPLPLETLDYGIPLQSRLGVLLAQVEINGKGPFTFLLDTGADTIFISPQLADQLRLGATTPIQVQGFCGLDQAKQSVLAQVTLKSKFDLNQQTNLEAVILASPSVLDVLKVDGILGQSFLNAYEQYWHFELKPNHPEFQGRLFLRPIP
ncbi:MAG: retropepsin-like aspartic protease [Microcoleaceae cyanobacterium]